jgi:hypothetical protein
MPTYSIIHKKTKKITQKFMSISEMEEWKKQHPNHEVLCGAPLIHPGGGLGLNIQKNDENFTSRIKQIKKNFPGNTLDRYVKT